MALELKFSKSNKETQWGFRIVGGADFDQPLVVVKVNENSIAEEAGLKVGDLIVRINDTSTAGLTHSEVHDLLVSVGLEFVIGIRRGVFPEYIRGDDDYNFEFTNMVEEIEKSLERDIFQEAVSRIEVGKKEFSEDSNNIISLSENLAGQEEMVYTKETQSRKTFTDTLTHGIKTDKKWSTFLMKPDKPVPKPKKVVEKEKVMEDGYKVVISKQPIKRACMQSEKKVQFDQNVVDIEVESQEDENNNDRLFVDEAENVTDSEEENRGVDEDNIDKDSIEEHNEINDELESVGSNTMDDINDYSELQKEELEETHYKPLSEIIVGDSESSMTLEEQLRTVQKQLQALSQLPSAVQVTLDAISAQLASIVSIKNSPELDEETRNDVDVNPEQEIKQSEEYGEECSVSEKAEAEFHHADDEDTNSSIGEELEEDIITDEIREIMARTEKEAEEEENEKRRIEEEEQARIREEEEKFAKEQKGMEERTKPLQRPIILPGGRKWSNPDDAIPSYRKPKMSEDKIMETIENNLEVIAGKRKGINFLKYEPPAKNMDYLQRSQVYRLIHDMEPPVKGIVSRPEVVPAVQDYYEATQGAR